MYKNRSILSVVFMLCPILLFAQGWESRVPYFRYNLSLETGLNQLYGDLTQNKPSGPSARVKGAMFLVHGIELGIEAEVGLLKADNGASDLGDLWFAKNNYTKGALGLRFYPLLFLQNNHDRRVEYRMGLGRKILNRVYVGVGLGLMYNTQLGVNEEYEYPVPVGTGSPYPVKPEFSKQDRGISGLTVINGGVDIPISSLNPNKVDFFIWSINFNVQSNIGTTRGEDIIDGWPIGSKADVYNVYSVGLKVAF